MTSTWLNVVTSGHAAPSDERTFKAVANSLFGQNEVLEFGDGHKGDALDALTESWMARPVIGKSTDPKGKAIQEDKRLPAERMFAEAEGLAQKRSISLADALGEVGKANEAGYAEYHAASYKPMRGGAQ